MLKESDFVKIRVTVPVEATNKVRLAMGEAGAGKVGSNYEYCAFVYPVQGFFRPLQGAKPALGEVGNLEEVSENMIEMICHKDLVEKVMLILKKTHPYEEPAIDIVPRFEF